MLYSKGQVLQFENGDWRKDVMTAFAGDITDKKPKFPCIFGTQGYENDELRFVFMEDLEASSMEHLAAALRKYVEESRTYGKYTSLAAFFDIDRDKTMDEYQEIFWSTLMTLNKLDEKEWPKDIPTDTEDQHWEFCFHGEPIFVVCNTPSHQLRNSRSAETFMITFQPRWVFDGLGIHTPAFAKSQQLVRKLIKEYDEIDVFPHLGTYGSEGNKEWRQYFLTDSNDVDLAAKCPFHAAMAEKKEEVKRGVECVPGEPIGLEEAVFKLLPKTGSVEVQRDTPGREHKTHTHPTDETLLIVGGDITFFVDGEEIHCTSGDRILLPAYTEHSSIAGENGCLYIIALQFVVNSLQEEALV